MPAYAEVSWHVSGPEDGPVLVLLHPIATDHSVWVHQIRAWQDNYRIIALDLPGHGQSPAHENESTMVALAERTARSLIEGGVEKCVLIGVSLGSMIAQRIAASHPDIVDGAVLANGIALATQPLRDTWQARIAASIDGGMESICADTVRRWFTPELLSAEPEAAQWIGSLVTATDPLGYRNAAQAIATLDNRNALSAIGCPVLVLSSENDLATPAQVVESIAKFIPDARIQRIDAPHLAQFERPDLFNVAVDTFLDRLPGYGI